MYCVCWPFKYQEEDEKPHHISPMWKKQMLPLAAAETSETSSEHVTEKESTATVQERNASTTAHTSVNRVRFCILPNKCRGFSWLQFNVAVGICIGRHVHANPDADQVQPATRTGAHDAAGAQLQRVHHPDAQPSCCSSTKRKCHVESLSESRNWPTRVAVASDWHEWRHRRGPVVVFQWKGL